MPLTEEEKRQRNIDRCRRYRQTHLEERRAKEGQYTREHPERSWRNYERQKRTVLSYYCDSKDPHCVICGEDRSDCLSIDHIWGNGSKERRTMHSQNFYQFLIRGNFPSGYQTLCMNCQFIKRAEKYREERERRVIECQKQT